MFEERVEFRNPEDRLLFFEKARESAGCKTWNEFYEKTGINRSQLQFYRNGKLLVPRSLFDKFSCLDEFDVVFKSGKWGCVKGGRAMYQKHKDIFDKGRGKAISLNAKRIQRMWGETDFNMPLSEELCEFLGAFIGDGFTGKYGKTYWTELTGDKTLD